MLIKVGLSTSDLKLRVHRSLGVTSKGQLFIESGGQKWSIPPKTLINVTARGAQCLVAQRLCGKEVRITSGSPICLTSLRRKRASSEAYPCYHGALVLRATNGMLQAALECHIETYLRGVLESEMPASYHLEALKAQAVLARTYALRPRVSHASEGFHVCDSYLCCQYFAGFLPRINPRQAQAIEDTAGQILTFDGKPILALFSANAGGHTEDYQNCFSDPETNAFPPEPIPYLAGVSEGKLPHGFPSEEALRVLWSTPSPDTIDSWSSQFRWRVTFSADALEGHMHHVVKELSKDPQFAPFIAPPPSNQFGHIDRFQVTRRGVSGVAISITIHTSTGPWHISKELAIRSAFKNPEVKLARLRSARIFFDHHRDSQGLLSRVVVSGLGTGHGVGMQQTGAQGWAQAGKNYRQILAHYYANTSLGSI